MSYTRGTRGIIADILQKSIPFSKIFSLIRIGRIIPHISCQFRGRHGRKFPVFR